MTNPEDVLALVALGTILISFGYFLGGIRPGNELLDEKRRHEKTRSDRDDYRMKYEEWANIFKRATHKAKT